MDKRKLLLVIGTRPDAIKMAPLAIQLRNCSYFETKLLSTGQHKELIEQVLPIFDLQIDYNFDLMVRNQSLLHICGQIFNRFSDVITDFHPDMVLVHGDTTTALAVSLASFYCRIPVAHIEAGLRSGDNECPFPEEINRVLISRLATYHFTPTMSSKENLLSEGIPHSKIFVTGNTVVDALLYVKSVLSDRICTLTSQFASKRIILITVHRRENQGQNLVKISNALKRLALNNKEVCLLVAVHPNPNVSEPLRRHLKNVANIHLIEPLNYAEFVSLMIKAFIILTDSSGIQEEAPSLGKPVFLLRQRTERIENETNMKIIGIETENIVKEVQEVLENPDTYIEMAKKKDVYGDGTAAMTISKILTQISFTQKNESMTLNTEVPAFNVRSYRL